MKRKMQFEMIDWLHRYDLQIKEKGRRRVVKRSDFHGHPVSWTLFRSYMKEVWVFDKRPSNYADGRFELWGER